MRTVEIIDGKRRCNKCLEMKKLSEFFKVGKKSPNQVRSVCKVCIYVQTRIWEHNNGEKIRVSAKKSYWRNREKCRKRSLQYHRTVGRKVMYGIDVADYARMFEKQKGVCAICKKPETRMLYGRVSQLGVDHCHVSGRVRGLLCAKCNLFVGFVDRNPALLEALSEYLTEVS